MNRKFSLLSGYLALTVAQTAIGLNVVTSKYLLSTLPMFMLLSTRFFLSSIALAILLKITKSGFTHPHHPLKKLTQKDWLLTILQGILATFIFNLFFVFGLQYTTATAAGIISSAFPAITALLAVWFLKERLNAVKLMAIALAILGVITIHINVLTETVAKRHYIGDLFIFLALFPEAWYSILSKKLASRVTPLGSALVINLVGFFTLFPCALLTSTFHLEHYSHWETGLIFISAASSLLFFWAWPFGLSLIPASVAAIFGSIMPVSTLIFAVVFLGERLSQYDILGIILIVISLLVGTHKKARQ